MKASEKFRIRVLPAGRDDRTVEVTDGDGRVLKYIYCQHRVGNDIAGLDADVVHDWEKMDADEFVAKYEISTAKESGSGGGAKDHH